MDVIENLYKKLKFLEDSLQSQTFDVQNQDIKANDPISSLKIDLAIK